MRHNHKYNDMSHQKIFLTLRSRSAASTADRISPLADNKSCRSTCRWVRDVVGSNSLSKSSCHDLGLVVDAAAAAAAVVLVDLVDDDDDDDDAPAASSSSSVAAKAANSSVVEDRGVTLGVRRRKEEGAKACTALRPRQPSSTSVALAYFMVTTSNRRMVWYNQYGMVQLYGFSLGATGSLTVVEVELAGGSQYHMEKAPQREKERS